MSTIIFRNKGEVTAEIKLGQHELPAIIRALDGTKATFGDKEINAMLATGVMNNLFGTTAFMSYFTPLFQQLYGQSVSDVMKEAVGQVLEKAKETGQSVFDGEKVHLSDSSRKAIANTFQREGEELVKTSIARLLREALDTTALGSHLRDLMRQEVETHTSALSRASVRTYMAQLEVKELVADAIKPVLPDGQPQLNTFSAPSYLSGDFANADRAMLKVTQSAFYQELSRFSTKQLYQYVGKPGQVVVTSELLPPEEHNYANGTIVGIFIQTTDEGRSNIFTDYFLPRV